MVYGSMILRGVKKAETVRPCAERVELVAQCVLAMADAVTGR
jgi:hypothetical protein